MRVRQPRTPRNARRSELAVNRIKIRLQRHAHLSGRTLEDVEDILITLQNRVIARLARVALHPKRFNAYFPVRERAGSIGHFPVTRDEHRNSRLKGIGAAEPDVVIL